MAEASVLMLQKSQDKSFVLFSINKRNFHEKNTFVRLFRKYFFNIVSLYLLPFPSVYSRFLLLVFFLSILTLCELGDNIDLAQTF